MHLGLEIGHRGTVLDTPISAHRYSAHCKLMYPRISLKVRGMIGCRHVIKADAKCKVDLPPQIESAGHKETGGRVLCMHRREQSG